MVLPPDDLLEFENRKKKADAEREAIEAEQKLLNAQKALNDLINPDPAKAAHEKATAAANAAKSQADAEKAAADADKAKIDASTSALKAKIGDIPASGLTGDVTVKDNAGILESGLLAARSVKKAANKIMSAIPPDTSKKTILLYSLGEIPNFQALITFNAQTNIVRMAFKDAGILSVEAQKQEPFGETRAELLSLGAIGMGIDAVSKLASYFKTDYTYAGVQVNFEDSLLIHALSGLLASKKDKFDVQLPPVYNPSAYRETESQITRTLIELSERNISAKKTVKLHEKTSARLTEEAAKAGEPEKSSKLQKAKTHKDATEALKNAQGIYTAFTSKLNTPDSKNIIPLATVLQENAVAEKLDQGGYFLIVKIQKTGGAYYTMKNLWTFFWWGIPLYHMGGTVTSFVLLDGKTANVITSGVIPVHGGYVRAGKLQALIDNE